MNWEVPVLQKLEVEHMWKDGDTLLPWLPDVQTLHFHWDIWNIFRLEEFGERRLEIRQDLEGIVSKYNDMQILSIRSCLRPIWDEFVQDLGEQEQLTLPTIVFE
jgi:hypothetical protein